MKRFLVSCLVLLILIGMTFSVNAEDAGSITLDFTQFNDKMNMANQLEKPLYGVATVMPLESTEFTSMNIRVVKVEDGVESTCWESNVTALENISIALESGTYKVYTQLEGDDTILEYNNDSEGYVITPQSHPVIPMAYQPTEGYILDVPWRIESFEINIPILAVDNDWFTEADINNIYVYDHNNGDSLVESTNWASPQPINSNNRPFFYLFEIDKNLFVHVDGEASIRIKFDLHWSPDNWEGPVNVRISQDNIPKLIDWYCGDTHLHTNYTHNAVEYGAPIYTTRAANKAMGLNWMIVTDHSFDLDSDKWTISTADCNGHSDNLFRVIQGEEVSCYLPGTDTIPGQYQYNHLLVYGPDFIPGGEWEDGTGSDYTPAEAIAIANTQGGVTYPAHPFDDDPFRDPWQDYSLNFNGLQIWNYGSEDNIAKLESGIEIWKKLLLDGRQVYVEGGTDAHGDFNTHAGRVKTYAYVSGYSQSGLPTQNEILDALRNGNSIMTDGPLVVFNITNEHGKIAIIGDEIAGDELTLNIQWESTSEFGDVDNIYVHRGIIGETEEKISEYHLTPNSLTGTKTYADLATWIPESKAVYIRLNATTDQGYRVYTNPIWITPKYKIAVTEPYYDEMQDTLDSMNYEYVTIDPGVLTDYDQIKMYDIIFVNCAGGLEPIASSAAGSVRQFVDNGGVLYASDWAFTFLENSFPGYIDFIGYVGITGSVTGDVTDAGLADYLGSNTIPLVFDLGAWIPIDNISGDVRAYAMGDITYSVPSSSSITEASILREKASLMSTSSSLVTEYKPIVVGFEYGNGTVIYTSFHHRAQGPLAAELMKYLALTAVTEDLAKQNEEMLESEGYEVVKDNRGRINQGETVDYTYTAEKGENFKILLNWAGSTLKLSVYDPNGVLYDEVESDTPPIGITVENAQSNYTYGVTGSNVLYDNYEYVATIGKQAPPVVEQVPTLTPIGITALAGLLLVLGGRRSRKKRR